MKRLLGCVWMICGGLAISIFHLSGQKVVQARAFQTPGNDNSSKSAVKYHSEEAGDWPAYGGSPEDTHYSSLSQINRTNVKGLKVAWSFDTGEPGGLETSPIIVDGVLYGIAPTQKIFALNAATGKLLWKFDSGMKGTQPDRGLVYWSNGSDRRILVGVMNFLYALDAATGKPIATFGKDGRIDLREGLGRDPERQSVVIDEPGDSLQGFDYCRRTRPGNFACASGRRARLRRTIGEIAMVVSYHSASGRIWVPDMARGRLEIQRSGKQLGGHGGRSDARNRLCADGIGGV